MSNALSPSPYTLESIAQQKAELLQKIRNQKGVISDLAKEILVPVASANNKVSAIMRAFNTGMAVFDGVRLGLKVMKKIRSFFSRTHR